MGRVWPRGRIGQRVSYANKSNDIVEEEKTRDQGFPAFRNLGRAGDRRGPGGVGARRGLRRRARRAPANVRTGCTSRGNGNDGVVERRRPDEGCCRDGRTDRRAPHYFPDVRQLSFGEF